MLAIKNRSSLVFLVVAFAVAWPAFFFATPQAPVPMQVALLILGSYAPAIAATAALAVDGNVGQTQAFRQRLRNWRGGGRAYLAAVALPAVVWLPAALLHSALAAPQPIQWARLLAFPLIFVTNWGEEAGWRGLALPRLLVSLRPLPASLGLGLVWGAFHLPLYWQRPLFAVLFLGLAPALSVVLTRLFLSSGQSVWVCTLFHAVYNAFSQAILPAEAGEGLLAGSVALTWIVAAYMIYRHGPDLHRPPPAAVEIPDAG